MEENNRVCTFLNGHGDITISWSESDDVKMKELISKKMESGYQFFIIKPRFLGIFGCSTKNIASISDLNKKSVTILDKDIEIFIKEAHEANLLSSQGDASYDVVSCAATAHDVCKNQTVAVKPVRGG
jgi:hypothetical protein